MAVDADGSPVRAGGAVPRRVLADHVFDALLTRLMDGALPAGSSLNIDGLARELGVSPTPVREALARLEATRLVQRAALRGYSVAPAPSAKELSDLMDARLTLEPVNAHLACQRVDEDFLAGLTETIETFEKAPNGPTYRDFREHWAADERFHSLIAEHAGNPFLLAAYQSLGGLAQRFRQFSGVGVTDARSALSEHRAILRAFMDRDPALAREEMERHIRGVRSRSLADFSGEPPEDDDAR